MSAKSRTRIARPVLQFSNLTDGNRFVFVLWRDGAADDVFEFVSESSARRFARLMGWTVRGLPRMAEPAGEWAACMDRMAEG